MSSTREQLRPPAELEELSRLRWWSVGGAYAEALVAAESEDEAVAIAREHGSSSWVEWVMAEPAEHPVPPGPPFVAGLYAWFGA